MEATASADEQNATAHQTDVDTQSAAPAVAPAPQPAVASPALDNVTAHQAKQTASRWRVVQEERDDSEAEESRNESLQLLQQKPADFQQEKKTILDEINKNTKVGDVTHKTLKLSQHGITMQRHVYM